MSKCAYRDTARHWTSGVWAASWGRWSITGPCFLASTTLTRSARSRRCLEALPSRSSPSSATPRPSCMLVAFLPDQLWLGQKFILALTSSKWLFSHLVDVLQFVKKLSSCFAFLILTNKNRVERKFVPEDK